MKKLHKILCLIGIISLLAVSLTVVSAAWTNPQVYAEDYIDWYISEDGSSIVADGMFDEEYEYYYAADLSYGHRIENNLFVYQNTVTSNTGAEYTVYSGYYGAPVIYVTNGYSLYAYATDAGKDSVDRYLGTDTSGKAYMLINYNGQKAKALTESDVAAIKGYVGETLTVKVSELSVGDCYSIVYTDLNHTVASTHGAIYDYDGGLYYVDYDSLPNSYFDADGNFSYRFGTVEMTRLDGECRAIAEERIEDVSYYEDTYRYESDFVDYYEDEELISLTFNEKSSKVFLVTVSIIMGIVFPLVPFTVFLVRLIKRRREPDAMDIVITTASFIWLVAGVVLLIMFL